MQTVEVNGVQKRVPILAKLNRDLRNRLQSATMRKSMLSSIYRIEDDDKDHYYITGVKEKTGTDLDLAKRFFMWN